jgi:hypothetical protein
MIKYPHTKKNAQRYKYPLYQVWAKSTVWPCSSDLKNLHSTQYWTRIPRLATAPSQCIITCMSKPQYYYVMCEKGPVTHRCYVQLDRESADTLHDSLCERYDLVQVCDVKQSEVDPALLITPTP